jgi:hypothetical protein
MGKLNDAYFADYDEFYANIAEVQWFSRQSMLDAIAAGKLLLPPQISVSRRMIEYWYGENALVDLAASEGKLP